MEVEEKVKTFDVIFEGTARSSGKLRCDVDVEFVTTKETFQLSTDEGKIHGGSNTAPPPLALFTAALSSCLMTQIRAFAKRLRIPIESVEIQSRLHWRAEQVGRQPYVGEPIGFDLDINMTGPVSDEDKLRLLDAGCKGCFLEQTMGQVNTIKHRLLMNDEWVEVDV